jgi:hypothetical protein
MHIPYLAVKIKKNNQPKTQKPVQKLNTVAKNYIKIISN